MLFALQHGHDPSGPGIADGPYQDHGGDHIGNGKILDLGDAEAGGQHDQSAAGLEVVHHGRSGQREDQPGAEEQRKENHRLRDCHHAGDKPQRTGKNHGSENIQDGFGDQNTVISAHAGYDGAVNARPAGAEQHDGCDQQSIIGITLAGDQLRQALAPVFDALPQVRHDADDGAQDQGQDHGGHVLHQDDGRNTDAHRANTENQVQLLLEFLRQPSAAKRADDAAQRHG